MSLTLKLLEGTDSRTYPWFTIHRPSTDINEWLWKTETTSWILWRIESIELDCPKQTHDWIEYIYVSPLNRRGTFFSLGQLNKKTQKVTVYPGAVYNIKIRTRSGLWRYYSWSPAVQQILESSQRPEVGWSGPATLKLVGDRDQTEPIAIEAVSCNKFHATWWSHLYNLFNPKIFRSWKRISFTNSHTKIRKLTILQVYTLILKRKNIMSKY